MDRAEERRIERWIIERTCRLCGATYGATYDTTDDVDSEPPPLPLIARRRICNKCSEKSQVEK